MITPAASLPARLRARAAARLRPDLALPFLPVILAPFVLLAPVLLTGKALFWGTPYLQFVPWWNWAWETLRQGHLPLWNPQVGMGAPLIANYQSALFYPPDWLYLALAALGGAPALAWGQALLVALHLAWGGLGMAQLARRLDLNPLAQAVSGLAFGLCGYLVARGGFLSILSAAAWLPWILVALRPAAWKPSLPLVACLALQLLAGHAQTAWYSLLLAALWGGYWGWQQAGPRLGQRLRGVLAAWLGLALAAGLAAALAAVQLLPTLEYLSQSQRSTAVDYRAALTYSLWPWRLLSLFAPDLFGNPARSAYWGYGNYWEDAAYIGLLPLLLALGAILKWLLGRRSAAGGGQPAERLPRVAQQAVPFLIALSALGLLLALGQNTPVFPWLYFHVPSFAMFQAPARYLIWVEFALALLAGIGAQAWRPPQGRGLYWTRLAAAAALAVTLGAGAAGFLGSQAKAIPAVAQTLVDAAALAGLWGLGAALLSLAKPAQADLASREHAGRRVTAWQWAVVLFIAADLLVAGWGLNPAIHAAELYATPTAAGAAVSLPPDSGRIYLPEADERSLKFDSFFRFDTFDPGRPWSDLRAVLLPDSALLAGLASANNFDPLVPGRYARWMAALEQAGEPARSRLLDLMGVGWVERLDPAVAGGVRFNRLNESQPGRWRWTPCASLVPDGEAAWKQVFSGQVDFSQQVVLETGSTAAAGDCSAAGTGGATITTLDDAPNRTAARVSAPAPGWVVLSDVAYPGWQAWVDGKPAPLLRADYLFRAVAVPAGVHEVTFTYRPLSFWLGLAVSLLAAAILAIWGAARLRSPRAYAAS